MKSVDINLFGLVMMAVISLSGPVHAQTRSGTAPTVMIINSQNKMQANEQVAINQHKPSTSTSTSATAPQSTNHVTSKPMVTIQTPPIAELTDKPKATIVIETDKPAQPSVYHHVNRAEQQPKADVYPTTNAHMTLPLRDANDKLLEGSTRVDAATPATLAMPVNAYIERQNIPVLAINPATHNARLQGNIRGLEVDIYQFNGQQGQTVTITHDKSNPAIEVALFHPLIGTRFGPVHVLPETGNYELRIVQTRQDAAKNKSPRYYDIGFSIK